MPHASFFKLFQSLLRERDAHYSVGESIWCWAYNGRGGTSLLNLHQCGVHHLFHLTGHLGTGKHAQLIPSHEWQKIGISGLKCGNTWNMLQIANQNGIEEQVTVLMKGEQSVHGGLSSFISLNEEWTQLHCLENSSCPTSITGIVNNFWFFWCFPVMVGSNCCYCSGWCGIAISSSQLLGRMRVSY